MNATEMEIADILLREIEKADVDSERGIMICNYRDFMRACLIRHEMEQAAVLPAAPAGPVLPKFHIDPVKPRRGPKGRRVQVFGRDEENCTQQLKIGEIFDNASQASSLMGYEYNKVAMALKAAAAKGEETAMVDGLEFRCLDTDDDKGM